MDLRIERARFLTPTRKWDQATGDYSQACKALRKRSRGLGGARPVLRRGKPVGQGRRRFRQGPRPAPRRCRFLRQASSDLRELAQGEDLFTHVTRLRPKDGRLWVARVNRHASRGQWQPAAAARAKLIDLDPSDHWQWFQLAPLVPGTWRPGRIPPRVPRDAALALRQDRQARNRRGTAKTCLLAPNSGGDRQLTLKLAEQAVTLG